MEKKPLILNGWNVLEQGVTFKRKQQNFSIFSTWQHNTGQSPQNRSISQVQGWIKWPEVCVISVFWFFLFSNLIWQSDDGCLFTSSFCFSAYLARGDICEQTRENRSSVQSLSCVQLFATMNRSMPGLPVYHQLPEFTQTHVHWIGDAIQPSHPLPFPSPPALNLSQHQGLYKWVSSSHQVARVLELQLQRRSFQWIFRTDFL